MIGALETKNNTQRDFQSLGIGWVAGSDQACRTTSSRTERPHVGAALAAGSAHKPRFDIGQPDIIRPGIAADRDRVAAAVIRAVDQETANEMTACDMMTASGQKRKFGPVVRFATMVVTLMTPRGFVSVGN